MKHHTKTKGDRGVGEVIADVMRKGHDVCLPISEHLPFDIVIVKEDGSLLRTSVKYRATTKQGNIHVAFASMHADKHGNHRKLIDKSLIDIIAVFCPETMKVYYINPNEFEKGVTLRIKKAKNGQIKNTHFADDYMPL